MSSLVKDTVIKIADVSKQKINMMENSIVKYFILSIMAGVYVGFGVVLAFSIGAPFRAAGSPGLRAIMGASFGIALTLVVFAGSEIFTGNNMVMTIGYLCKQISFKSIIKISIISFIGNLAGSLLLAYAMKETGLISQSPLKDFILDSTSYKMNAPFRELFARGILCNMLVCLALWTSARAKEETARLILIFWCLFGFIGAGFEHSIANMTIMGMGVLIPHDPALMISLSGFIYNLAAVTLGNLVGGALLIGAAYWYISVDS